MLLHFFLKISKVKIFFSSQEQGSKKEEITIKMSKNPFDPYSWQEKNLI